MTEPKDNRMNKKQQQYLRKQAAVKTNPAPPVKRVETKPEDVEAAREKRRAHNRKIEQDRRKRLAEKTQAQAGEDTQSADKAANTGKGKE